MSNSVVIVESPSKSKTLESYLGKDYKVLASYGHVRDLLPKKGAVDPENNFAMIYETIERNEKQLMQLKEHLKKLIHCIWQLTPIERAKQFHGTYMNY